MLAAQFGIWWWMLQSPLSFKGGGNAWLTLCNSAADLLKFRGALTLAYLVAKAARP